MITHIRLQNYRSFVDAEVDLAPFTLVVGANGAGKTNFLMAFVDCGPAVLHVTRAYKLYWVGSSLMPHFNGNPAKPTVTLNFPDHDGLVCADISTNSPVDGPSASVVMFKLSPENIAAAETVVGSAFVRSSGSGTTQCLESLKNGDQEALFDAAEAALKDYVPEITKLSFETVEDGKKRMQVRERGINQPVPAFRLSEGTLLIIALLAIIHQPVKPPIICLEDIDRGMHPRVFEQMVELMGRIAREQDVQIIATTHNPYLVDCFHDEPEAVVIVEKKDGASTLATLADKLKAIGDDKLDETDVPLGSLWFSGLVGGVPEFRRAAAK